MKKILFLLLLITSVSYGQTTLANKLKITGNTLSTSTLKINTQETDGQINYIPASSLPISTVNALELAKKQFLSTGLLKNGAITINGDPTKFNITAGIGIISNFDDPENPISTIINFPAFTGVTPTYLTTGNITYIAINSTPAVVMQATPFTAIQRRDLIELGVVVHSNLTTINVINNLSSPTEAGTNQLHDLFDFIGALNLSGNVYSANGANLQLNKSAGIIGKRGVNFVNNWKDPHRLAQSAETALTFRYRTQNGTEGSDRVNLDPTLYDLNNVLTAVPNNKFVIETVITFQTGTTRILKSQQYYDDLQTAINAVLTRSFVIESNSKENGIIRAYIIMRNTTTSLQNVADAKILEAQKFGGVASGGVAFTLANIVTALGYTPENIANKSDSHTVSSSTTYASTKALVDGLNTRVTTTGTTGNIQRIVGTNTLGNSALTDNGTNVVSSLPLSVASSITGNSFVKSAATATNILLAGGTDITQASLFASYLPQLESNNTDLTVWNNGKGNESTNTSFGEEAFKSRTTGTSNTVYGRQSLSLNTTGASNTAVGLNALGSVTTGSLNTGLGFASGQYTSDGVTFNSTSDSSVYLGNNTKSSGNGQTNQIVIGYNAIGAGSNTATLGNTSITQTILRGAVTTNGSFINSTAPATNALLANGATLANPISGTGTTGYLSKFTASGTIGNSIVSESGSMLNVAGTARFKEGVGTYYAEAGSDTNYSFFRGGNSGLGTLVYDILGKGVFMQPFSGSLIVGGLTDNGVDRIQSNGSILATQYKISALNTAPASATATGTTGEIRITAGFIYVCTATNTWVRTALATW